VGWMFEPCGLIYIEPPKKGEDPTSYRWPLSTRAPMLPLTRMAA